MVIKAHESSLASDQRMQEVMNSSSVQDIYAQMMAMLPDDKSKTRMHQRLINGYGEKFASDVHNAYLSNVSSPKELSNALNKPANDADAKDGFNGHEQTKQASEEEPRETDNPTRQKKMTQRYQHICSLVASYPGKTSRELALLANMNRYAVARRLPEAEKRQLIRRGHPRKCSISGRKATTWQPFY